VIALEAVSARRKPVSIKNVTIEWGQGIHALVGTFADGCGLLLAVIVGAAKPQGGRIRVLDRAPTDPHVRAQVARVGIDPSLPEALRVDEALTLASVIRGEPPQAAAERLSVLGLEALARRPVQSLSRGEARGVALIEGLTSSRVRVLVLEEPFASSDARAAGRIAESLRGKSRTGCAIVLATASLRDAEELADDYVLVRAGTVVGKTTAVHDLARLAPGGARLIVVARHGTDARALLPAFAGESDVTAVEVDANIVTVRGADPVALARAAGRAAVQANIDVVEIRREPKALDEAI
jgi:ABC-2 type transport system ATP-binding protein